MYERTLVPGEALGRGEECYLCVGRRSISLEILGNGGRW